LQEERRNDMAELLSEEEIAERLEGTEWKQEGEEIVRDWKFSDFAEAISFVDKVAEVSEEANHHPDILLHGWNKVRLAVSNHSAGGLTEADFNLARKVDGLA
jgi:4a-hydroxytetrahydrobiopterin dehydratase